MSKNKKEKKVSKKSSSGQGNKGSIEEDKPITYLSYIGLFFLVPLLTKKESKFVQFHAKQGLVLTFGWVIGGVLLPFFGVGFIVYVLMIVLSIMGLVNVSQGEMKDLPIAGDLAKKFDI